jgi:hypothetical protein
MKLWRKDRFKNSTRVYFSNFAMNWYSHLTISFYFARETNYWWRLNNLIYKAASKLCIPPSQITEEHVCSYISTSLKKSYDSKSKGKI